MSDLVEKLKGLMRIEDVVERDKPLKASGRGFVGVDHDSLHVDAERGFWTWFSQDPGAGQKALGGDALSWIAHQRFGRIHVDGEDFVAVLKEACAIAGLDYEKESGTGTSGEAAKRAAQKREREETLARFCQVAEDARTPEFFVRCRQINQHKGKAKTYLSRECIERWRIGFSPSLKACLDAGLTELQLRGLGLLCDPLREGPDEQPYMFFRDSLLIPFFEYGRAVFLASRYLSTHDGRGIEREKKTLLMRVPSKANGWTGLQKPCGFNLDALRDPLAKEVGVTLVEAPLDAIAMTELKHPAIGMLGSFPGPELVRRLRAMR